jgi:hypothetical protein
MSGAAFEVAKAGADGFGGSAAGKHRVELDRPSVPFRQQADQLFTFNFFKGLARQCDGTCLKLVPWVTKLWAVS